MAKYGKCKEIYHTWILWAYISYISICLLGPLKTVGAERHAAMPPRPPRQGTASRARVPFVSNPVRAEPAAALWRVGGLDPSWKFTRRTNILLMATRNPVNSPVDMVN